MKVFSFCLAAAALFSLGQFCIKQTDGFTVAAVSSNRPYDERWAVRPLTPSEETETRRVLQERFTYFGCGGQAYIFFSSDGKYVLKLFKQRVFRPPLWLQLPLPSFLDRYRTKKLWKREDKLERDFTSYKTAFEELQELTGVVFVHLNRSANLQQSLRIVDKLGIEHHLAADRFDFVIQRRGELVYDMLNRLMAQGNRQEAERRVAQVLRFIVDRCQLGFHDRDPNIRTNCGFLEGRVIKIDVGRLVRDERMREPAVYRKELLRIAAPFRAWLATEHPSLIPSFEQELQCIESSL